LRNGKKRGENYLEKANLENLRSFWF